MPDVSPCAFLARPDKWYLGGGHRLVWTPTHPQWLDAPGFWDEAHYYDLALAPLFTVTVLDRNGRAISCHLRERQWQPDRLLQRYQTSHALTLTERRALLPSDVLASRFTLQNHASRPLTLHLVQWTVQPTAEHGTHLPADTGPQGLRFRRRLSKKERPVHEVVCTLGSSCDTASAAVIPSESAPPMPRWAYTPFYECFAEGRLRNPASQREEAALPHRYLGLHVEVTIPPQEEESVSFGCSVAPASKTAPPSENGETPIPAAVSEDAPVEHSTAAWERFFESVPSFTCSDAHLEKYYWYRWYGLHLFTLPGGAERYPHPAVCEGPGYFRKFVTYSAQCHIREMRWKQDPQVARGSLLNFIENQRDGGGFYGHVFPRAVQENSFYHADWSPVWDLHRTRPDDDFLARAYDGLSAYARYFDRERDPEGDGLYDIVNHYETGQEYMHRYVAVDETADQVHWGRNFRLKGVDAAVQLYQTKRALAKMARRLDRPDEAAQWGDGADATRAALREQMWDPQAEMFLDVDPRTGERTGVKAAVCFYPYFTDVVTEEHLPGLKRHLLDPEEFWTPYPAPSSSRDDPYFSAAPHWKGARMNCPWNGRVWPMTNSHLAEALAQTALHFDDAMLRRKAAVFMKRFAQMLFAEGNPERPNCFEHYNPLSGKPCRYRGVDDYQHSWIVDLIVKYVCGIRPQDDALVIDPFPFDLDTFHVEGVPVRGAQIGVRRSGDVFHVEVDGEDAGESSLGTPVRLSL